MEKKEIKVSLEQADDDFWFSLSSYISRRQINLNTDILKPHNIKSTYHLSGGKCNGRAGKGSEADSLHHG